MKIELTKEQRDKINNLDLTIIECIHLGMSGIIQMSDKMRESEWQRVDYNNKQNKI